MGSGAPRLPALLGGGCDRCCLCTSHVGVPTSLGVYAGVRAGGCLPRRGGTVHAQLTAQGPGCSARNPNTRHSRSQYRRCTGHQWIWSGCW